MIVLIKVFLSMMSTKKIGYYVVGFFLLIIFFANQYQTQLLNYIQLFHQQNFPFYLKFLAFNLYTLIIVFMPVPFGGISRIIAGILFGFELGFIIALIVMNLMAMFQIFVFRKLQHHYDFKLDLSDFEKIKNKVDKNGFEAIIWLRIIFLFPYQIINMSMAFTKIKYRDFYIGSIIGEVPVTLFYTFLASAILNLNNLDLVKKNMWVLALMSLIYGLILLLIKFRNKIFNFIHKTN